MSEVKAWGCPTCEDKGFASWWIEDESWIPKDNAEDGEPCPTCAAHHASVTAAVEKEQDEIIQHVRDGYWAPNGGLIVEYIKSRRTP